MVLVCPYKSITSPNVREEIKTMEWEDTTLASSHTNTKITTVYREAIYENDLKTSGQDFAQMKDPGPQVGNLEMEGYHKDIVPPQGARGPNRIWGPRVQEPCTGKVDSQEAGLSKPVRLTFRRTGGL